MKRAIQIGAGNIGRGFIAALLHNSGYHVVFADIAENIINEINTKKHYTINVQDLQTQTITIDTISGVLSSSEDFIQEITQAEIITTAVGAKILEKIAPAIAKGIKARKTAGITQPLNIIACENAVSAGTLLKNAVMSHLNEDESTYAEKVVGFPNCSVDRIVPPARHENLLDVSVEEFYEWNVEKAGFRGDIPHIEGMNISDNLSAYIERKLFTLNTGHAITAYLGLIKGYSFVDESIADTEIENIVINAMKESGNGLIDKFAFDKKQHYAYIEKIIKRFKNPYLKDELKRVGREPIRKLSPMERFVKPLQTAREYNHSVEHLILGMGAALHYRCETDAQSIELQKLLQEMGVIATVQKISEITDNSLLTQIEKAYHQF